MPALYEVPACGCDVARISQLFEVTEGGLDKRLASSLINSVIESMPEVAPNLVRKLGEAGIRAVPEMECGVWVIQATRLERSFLQIVRRQFILTSPRLPKQWYTSN